MPELSQPVTGLLARSSVAAQNLSPCDIDYQSSVTLIGQGCPYRSALAGDLLAQLHP